MPSSHMHQVHMLLAVLCLHTRAPQAACTSAVARRALDIRIKELGQDFGGSDDVPAQLLHSLAGAWLHPIMPSLAAES